MGLYHPPCRAIRFAPTRRQRSRLVVEAMAWGSTAAKMVAVLTCQKWGYKLGGYQVLKKWLSYRERGVLGRALKPEEVQHFTDTARRIGAILQ